MSKATLYKILNSEKVIIMAIQKAVGHFSEAAGNTVRRVYTPEGTLLGVIRKLSKGYKIYRVTDGKERIKPTLAEAFKSIRRSN